MNTKSRRPVSFVRTSMGLCLAYLICSACENTKPPQVDSPAADTRGAYPGAGFATLTEVPFERIEGLPAPSWAPDPVGLDVEVFAPFACSVSVAGDFNGWDEHANHLTRLEDGTWVGYVAQAMENDAYRLVIHSFAGTFWRNDPRAKQVTNSVGDSVVTKLSDEREPFEPVPWNQAIIYEMHVGTFVDEEGGRPGTFDSAIAKLDVLESLGVTHLQLMPVAEFAGDFSWGYNPAHIFAVESAYGGLSSFQRFVEAAHERGMAVIVDVVYNHLGPSDLDLWRFDGWFEGDGGGVYFYNDWRAQTPWGHTRPDYGREQVRDFLTDNARYWLEDLGVDGLRVDSTGNIRATHNGGGTELPDGWTFLQELNHVAHHLPQWKVMIAEDLGGLGSITLPPEYGGAGFDAQWDANFVHPVRDVLTASYDHERNMHELKRALTFRVDGSPFNRVIYTESHDEVANGRSRIPEEIWPGHADSWFSKRRAALGLALTLTGAGVPMLFQGQEFVEDGWFSDTDPLDWEKHTLNGDFWAQVQAWIALRRNQDGTTRGLTGPHIQVQHVDDVAKVIGYHRWAFGGSRDDVVVALRFRDGDPEKVRMGVPQCGTWHVRAAMGDPSWTETMADQSIQSWEEWTDQMPCTLEVPLGAYGAIALSQD